MFDHILIACDDSPYARRAFDKGIQLAATLKSKVTLLSVLEPLPGYVGMALLIDPKLPEVIREDAHERFADLQSKARANAHTHGLEIETLLVEGKEVDAILEGVRTVRADLLVVGLPHHSAVIDFPGTVRRLANEITCPVLGVN